MDKIDTKVIELGKTKLGPFVKSKLILGFSGKNITPTLCNSLRRLSLDYITKYAFTKKSILIEKNTSIFDNDYMKDRISQFTFPNLKCDIYYLEDIYWNEIDFMNDKRDRHPKDNINPEMYINAVNDTNEIINITTNDARFYINDELIDNPYNKDLPWLIIKLKPGQSFICKAKAVLATAKLNSIWMAAHAYYDYDEDANSAKFTIESMGQFSEYEILHKGCRLMIDKLENLKKTVKESNINDNKVYIKLVNEDHTLGGVVNEYLQLNKNIAFSGLSKPDHLVNEILFKIESVSGNPIGPIIQTLDNLINVYKHIKKQIMKLGSDQINYETKSKIKKKKKSTK